MECQWWCCVADLSILNSTGRTEKSVLEPSSGVWWRGGGKEYACTQSSEIFVLVPSHSLWLLCEFLINTDHTNSLLKLSSFHFILHAVLWSLASKPTMPELKAVGHPL